MVPRGPVLFLGIIGHKVHRLRVAHRQLQQLLRVVLQVGEDVPGPGLLPGQLLELGLEAVSHRFCLPLLRVGGGRGRSEGVGPGQAPPQEKHAAHQKEDQDNPRHGESPAALFPAAGLGRGLSRPAGVAGIRIGRHKGLLSRHRRYEPP